MKISFIGFGNMAKAIANSLINNPEYQLHAASPSLPIGIHPDKIATHHDNLAIIPDADVLILAVKPINMRKVLEQINTTIPKNCLIISVATGLNLSWLASHCQPKQAIIRCMPNICVSVLQGATPLIANEFATNQQKQTAAHLFERSGIITWLDNEDEINVYTALSGSGPAYVFYFLEAISKAAIQLGINVEEANRFSVQTVLGAAELAQKSDLSFQQLRQQVTSPAGTTAAALKQLVDNDFSQILFKALEAAYLRAVELGKGSFEEK